MNKLIPLIKISIIFLLILSCYYILIVPVRIVINNNIFYPAISSIFPYSEIKPNETSLVINSDDPNKFFYFKLPFGGYYIIPTVLLALKKNWISVKIFTYFHLFLFAIFLIFLMPFFNKALNYISFDFYYKLTATLGFILTFLAFKNYLTDS
jgi:hypothetical protein